MNIDVNEDDFSSEISSPSQSELQTHDPDEEKHLHQNTTTDHLRMSRRVTIFVGAYDFQSSIWKLPLNRRGWVIQERLMAPRTLYFGKDRIYWECNEKLCNEYLPCGLLVSGELFDQHYKRNYSLPWMVISKPKEPLGKAAL